MPVTQQPLNAAELAHLQASAGELQRYVQGTAALAIARRAAFWDALRREATRMLGADAEMAMQTIAGAELYARNLQADRDAATFAELVSGLTAGRYQLAPWVEADGRDVATHFGVVRAGQLGLWPLVPVLIIAAGAAALAGAWVLADLYLQSRKLEAEADQTRAQTASRITAAVTQLSASDPQAAAQLATALSQANAAANAAQPSWLDRLVQGAKDVVAGAATSGFGGVAVALGLLWLLSKRGRA